MAQEQEFKAMPRKVLETSITLDIPIELLAKWHDGYVAWLLKEAGIQMPSKRKKLRAA